jgi:nucleotide-binding universal stress UspA family protein
MPQFLQEQILVPIDFSDETNRAIRVAMELTDDPARVTAIHVAPPLATLEPGVVWEMISDESRCEQLRDAFCERYKQPEEGAITFEIRFGDPGHEITKYATEEKIGMIIMPSHGRTGLAHLLIGSVAERVVRMAHCPVLVLRE